MASSHRTYLRNRLVYGQGLSVVQTRFSPVRFCQSVRV
jgi:hypothetical protein